MIIYQINELKIQSLMAKSKKETPDRFSRRGTLDGKWDLERVGLLELLSGSEDLYLYFTVSGYRVSVILQNFKPILNQYLTGKFKNDKKKAISRALSYGLKNCHVKTSCSCPDYRYRFAYMATKRGYVQDDFHEERPASIRNPKNKGGLCKHQLRILSIPSKWKPKVITALHGYTVKAGE